MSDESDCARLRKRQTEENHPTASPPVMHIRNVVLFRHLNGCVYFDADLKCFFILFLQGTADCVAEGFEWTVSRSTCIPMSEGRTWNYGRFLNPSRSGDCNFQGIVRAIYPFNLVLCIYAAPQAGAA